MHRHICLNTVVLKRNALPEIYKSILNLYSPRPLCPKYYYLVFSGEHLLVRFLWKGEGS